MPSETVMPRPEVDGDSDEALRLRRAQWSEFAQRQASGPMAPEEERAALALLQALVDEYRRHVRDLAVHERVQDADAVRIHDELGQLLDTCWARRQGSATFPSAGDSNTSVVVLVHGTLDHWELGGSDPTLAPRLINRLLDAAGMTFHEVSVFRGLFLAYRTLAMVPEAVRTLDVYRQMVLQHKETSSKVSDGSAADAGERDELVLSILSQGALFLVEHARFKEALGYATECFELLNNWHVEVGDKLRSQLLSVKAIVYSRISRTADNLERPKLQAAAIEAFNEAIKLDDSQADVYFELAHLQASSLDISSAISSVKKSLRLDQSKIQSYHLLALLYSATQQLQKALQTCLIAVGIFERSCELTVPWYFSIHDYIAVQHVYSTYIRLEGAVNGIDAAEGTLRAAFDLSAVATSDSRSVIGVAHENGEYKGLAGSKTAARSRIFRTRSRRERNRVKMISAAGAHTDSTEELLNSFQEQCEERQKECLVSLWLAYAAVALEKSDFELCSSAIEEARELDSVSCAVSVMHASFLEAAGHIDMAVEALENALFIDPDSTAVAVALAGLLVQVARESEPASLFRAKELLDFATRRYAWSSPEAWLYMGSVHQELGQLEQARKDIQYSLALERTRPIADWANVTLAG